MVVEGSAYASLLAAIHEPAFPPGERWDAAAMAELLAMPGCFACVHPPGSSPSGMALLRVAADEAELLTVAVLPAARGHGAGTILLGQAIAEAASRGAERMFLEVAPVNTAALGLYRKLGFTQAGRRRAYYPDGSDALVMVRTLGLSACGSRSA